MAELQPLRPRPSGRRLAVEDILGQRSRFFQVREPWRGSQRGSGNEVTVITGGTRKEKPTIPPAAELFARE